MNTKTTEAPPVESQSEKAVSVSAETLPTVQPRGIDELISHAVTHDFDLDKLQRLLDMRDAENKKHAKKEFFEALAAFQADCPPIMKSRAVDYTSQRTGTNTNYRYADLAAIEKVIKPIKLKHGFSHRFEYVEVPNPDDAKGKRWIEVTCILTHTGGHEERTRLQGPPDDSGSKNAIQSSGSSVTYLERYTLKGALGLTTTQDDNDGRGSGTGASQGKIEAVYGLKGDPSKPAAKPGQFKNLKDRVAKEGRETIESALGYFNLSPKELTELFALIPEEQRNPKMSAS